LGRHLKQNDSGEYGCQFHLWWCSDEESFSLENASSRDGWAAMKMCAHFRPTSVDFKVLSADVRPDSNL
jgi:hypothetical protein